MGKFLKAAGLGLACTLAAAGLFLTAGKWLGEVPAALVVCLGGLAAGFVMLGRGKGPLAGLLLWSAVLGCVAGLLGQEAVRTLLERPARDVPAARLGEYRHARTLYVTGAVARTNLPHVFGHGGSAVNPSRNPHANRPFVDLLVPLTAADWTAEQPVHAFVRTPSSQDRARDLAWLAGSCGILVAEDNQAFYLAEAAVAARKHNLKLADGVRVFRTTHDPLAMAKTDLTVLAWIVGALTLLQGITCRRAFAPRRR